MDTSQSTAGFRRALIAGLILITPAGSRAAENVTEVMGRKWPNAALPGEAPRVRTAGPVLFSDDTQPVDTMAELPGRRDLEEGFAELLPYVLPSPDQQDSGSCLFMATTGAAEWWLLRLNPELSRDLDGPADLSERFTMNAGSWLPGLGNAIENWLTDSIEVFNASSSARLNRDYRYTMGWFVQRNGKHYPAEENGPGASYGTRYNWISSNLAVGGDAVSLPRFSRRIIFADPLEDRWAVNTAPADITEQVKAALLEHKAPVLVAYNHYGIWHAVLVVGYNDEAGTRDCKFTSRFAVHMRARARALERQADKTDDARKKAQLLARARHYRVQGEEVSAALEAEGGCREKGMFMVRDSIYPTENEPLYDYDPSRTGEESPYSTRIVLREYAWLERLGNHVVQIFAK